MINTYLATITELLILILILLFLSVENEATGKISISHIPLANIICLCYGQTLLLPGEISAARFLTKLFYHP